MSLHKALATMTLQLSSLRVPEQLQDYLLPTPMALSRATYTWSARLLQRMDVPFQYNFQQTPYSELQLVPTSPHLTRPPGSVSFAHVCDAFAARADATFRQPRTAIHVTPQPFRVGRDTKVRRSRYRMWCGSNIGVSRKCWRG